MKFPRNVFEHDGCCGFIPQWKGGKNRRCEPIASDMKDDYEKITFEGEKWAAHRLSYHLNVSPIPRKPPARGVDNVLHSCDRKWCIKPDHLSLGDAKKNAQDNAARNLEWRRKRSEIQKALGGPKVTPEGARKRGDINKIKMKEYYAKNPEIAAEKCRKMREARWGR